MGGVAGHCLGGASRRSAMKKYSPDSGPAEDLRSGSGRQVRGTADTDVADERHLRRGVPPPPADRLDPAASRGVLVGAMAASFPPAAPPSTQGHPSLRLKWPDEFSRYVHTRSVTPPITLT